MRFAFAVLALAALTSCAPMTMSTFVRGRSFNESNLSFLDARGLGVKVAVPEGFVVDPDRTRLYATISPGATEREFALQFVGATTSTRGGGMYSKEVPVTVYEMDLPEASVRSLRELQGQISSKKVTSFDLHVRVKFRQVPPAVPSTRVWIELMVAPIEGYFLLVDGDTIPVGP